MSDSASDSIDPDPLSDRFGLKRARSQIALAASLDKETPIEESKDLKDARKVVFDAIAGLKVGDIDPWLGERIKVLIRKSTRHIVYLDENLDVQWWWGRAPLKLEVISEVQAEVTRLSNDCSFLTRPEFATPWISLKKRPDQDGAAAESARERLAEIRELLAEAIAHALDTSDLKSSKRILADAELQIQLEKERRCRPMFIEFFLFFTFSSAAFLYVCWTLLQQQLLVTDFTFAWMSAGVAGIFGALISATSRSAKLNLEPRSERSGLRTEALARALVGCGAGVLAGLAFDAGLFAVFKDTVSDQARLFVTIAAGASERMLPSLIGRAESAALGHQGRSTDADTSTSPR
ncbi:MAG: hypothetical protein SF172_04650 [Burkholderiales bacterium]|nr:hypothetical protein [Burkholderiales bacterium]